MAATCTAIDKAGYSSWHVLTQWLCMMQADKSMWHSDKPPVSAPRQKPCMETAHTTNAHNLRISDAAAHCRKRPQGMNTYAKNEPRKESALKCHVWCARKPSIPCTDQQLGKLGTQGKMMT